MEKLVSIYNLQDEKDLTVILDGKECLEYQKITPEVSDGKGTVRYRMSMKEVSDAVEFWDIFAKLYQRNTNLRMRVCNPE